MFGLISTDNKRVKVTCRCGMSFIRCIPKDALRAIATNDFIDCFTSPNVTIEMVPEYTIKVTQVILKCPGCKQREFEVTESGIRALSGGLDHNEAIVTPKTTAQKKTIEDFGIRVEDLFSNYTGHNSRELN